MTNPNDAETLAPASGHARDLQARLYREIGISAVAAALRFTTQPDPAARKTTPVAGPVQAAKSIAA